MQSNAPTNNEMLTSLENTVSLLQVSDIDFTVFPNPNEGNFTVQILGEIHPYTIEIFNASGGLVGKVDCYAKELAVNRSDLPAGIYYLKLTMLDKQTTKKLIVK
jgi:hypothetical protein